MARAQIDVGPFPIGVSSVVVDYKTAAGPWLKLGEARASVTYWTVPGDEVVTIRARPKTQDGRVHSPGLSTAWTPTEPVADRVDAVSVTAAAPVVKPDAFKLIIEPRAPVTEKADEWEVEVRVSADGGAAKDAVQVGFVEATADAVTATALPDQSTQTVHTRGVRKEDGRSTDWIATDVDVPEPEDDHPDDHTTDFASGTISKLGGTLGPSVMEINSGDLRFASIYIGDADGYIGDADDIYAGDANVHWSPGTYTTAVFELDANADIMLQVAPELTSTGRQTMYIGDAHWPIRGPRLQEDGTTPHDPRPFYDSLKNGADETPIVIEAKVATSATTGPTFVDADYLTLEPGKALHNVKAYAVRFVVYTYFGKQLTIDKLYVRRWIYCLSRPWCSHSSALELLYKTTLSGPATSHAITGLALDGFSEVQLDVVWQNAAALGTAKLAIQPNGDTTSGNYSPPVAGLEIGTAVAQNESERVSVIIRPLSGVERQLMHLPTFRWLAAAAPSNETEDSATWTNTADEITSISITTDDSGSAHLATGTTIRLWGRRR